MWLLHRRGRQLALQLFALACVLVGSPAWALDSRESLAHFGYQTWQTENGLPQNSVHAIAQSREGYLWLGTEDGLVRFDGFKFSIYDTRNTPQLRSNDIRQLLLASDGALWAATAGGVVRLEGSRFTAFTDRDGLPGDNVWSLFESPSAGLWAVTADGLAHYENGRFRASSNPSGMESMTGAIAGGERGSLWVGTRAGVRVFRDGRFARVPVQGALPNPVVDAILIDRSGHIWVGTQNGLVTWSELGSRVYSASNGLPGRVVTALYQDNVGTIWVGTDGGLARITNGELQRFPSGNTLAGNTILCIAEDREGNLWVGTEAAGVTIVREPKFTTYTARDGLAGDLVRAVFESRDGSVWFGTASGLSRFSRGVFSSLSAKAGLSSDVTLALAQDANDDILVGTPDGLNRIHGRKVSLLTSAGGLADDFVRSIYLDNDASLWISTRRGLTHIKNGHFTNYDQASGLGNDFTGAVVRDKSGALWVATLHGLSRFENGRFHNFTTAQGLSSSIITALYAAEDGTLWIGTGDGGLNRFRKGKFNSFAASLGLPKAVYGIADDYAGGLWLSSNAGIVRASLRDLNRAARGAAGGVSISTYGTADGLRINEGSDGGHPAVWRTRDGTFWFATPKGAAALPAGHVAGNRVPPPVVLESVSIDDRTFDPASVGDIKPGHSRFAFEYAGLSFSAPQQVRYRYKLEGFDKRWIDAGALRFAYYTNLPPGSYRFRVIARNSDGAWNSAGASLSFRLEPRFYQTYWFRILLLAALALLAYAVYRWRVKEVEGRFAAVLEERNRIAREIHDTLAQGFVGVSVQLEVVARLLASAPEAAREHLDQARTLVRNSIAEARSAIWELRSHSARNEDFASRLSKVANQAAAPGAVRVNLQVHGTYRPLKPKVEDELSRICQEAVTNAVRHGAARNVNIELAFERKKLRMTIVDDGRGFEVQPDLAGPSGHFGLKGMRERAERIDAQFIVDSKTGKGTRVSVEALVN
ncbi:MAG: hypothetical protein JOY54_02880 [Acidobacteriaceae bacterium]|nr:hypothetical protein [Acidobacteriaceae bacterium]